MSYVRDSTMRTCNGPGCPAAYDAVPGPAGQTAERHWLMHPTFGMHMCPDHSPLWKRDRSGPHCPNLDHETSTAACSCGHPMPGPTLGQMGRAYLDHLAALDPAYPSVDDPKSSQVNDSRSYDRTGVINAEMDPDYDPPSTSLNPPQEAP